MMMQSEDPYYNSSHPGAGSPQDDTMRQPSSNRTAANNSMFKQGNPDWRPYGCSQAFDRVDIADVRALYPQANENDKKGAAGAKDSSFAGLSSP